MSLPRFTLAIDLTHKGFGYAVLEGSMRLVDWGLARVRGRRANRLWERIDGIRDRYGDVLLVFEDPESSRRSGRSQKLLRELTELAEDAGLPWCFVTKEQVRHAFAGPANKFELASRIVDRFPELAHRLPRPRKPWMSEDERTAIFDSLAAALTVLAAFDGE